MARSLRIEFPRAVYHITSRGDKREKIFENDKDREIFLEILGSVVERYNFLCHAYCLMDNYYHLLIETPDGNLSQGIRQLNGVYTQKFNKIIRYTIERFAIRPRLSEIFSQIKNKKERNEKIYAAYIEYGYTLKEITDYLGIHYSTVSKAIKNEIKKQEQNSQFKT